MIIKSDRCIEINLSKYEQFRTPAGVEDFVVDRIILKAGRGSQGASGGFVTIQGHKSPREPRKGAQMSLEALPQHVLATLVRRLI